MSTNNKLIQASSSNYWFLPSPYVKIFPSAYRGREFIKDGKDTINNTGLDIEAKLSTELNYTQHLTSSYAKYSYLLNADIDKANNNVILTACINGYYIYCVVDADDLAGIYYIKLDTVDSSIIEGDDNKSTRIVKNQINDILNSKSPEGYSIPSNSHYLDSMLGSASNPTLCFGGISFYKAAPSTDDKEDFTKALPLFKRGNKWKNHHLLKQISGEPNKYEINSDVFEAIHTSVSYKSIEVDHYENINDNVGSLTNRHVLTNIVDEAPANSIAMNNCSVLPTTDKVTAVNSFAGGTRTVVKANNSLAFGDNNVIASFDPLKTTTEGAYDPTSQIIFGANNKLKYSRYDEYGKDVWGDYPSDLAYIPVNSTTIGHDITAVDDQIVIGRGINQTITQFESNTSKVTQITGNTYSTYKSSTKPNKRPYFIFGNNGSVLEVIGHDVYITGCCMEDTTTTKTFDGSLTVCGLSKSTTDTEAEEAIKLNEAGKLVRFTPKTTQNNHGKDSEDKQYTTSFLSDLSQDSVGNIKITKKTFTLSSTKQGQILLNYGSSSSEGATINISDLGTTGTPTFNTITTNGKATVQTLEVSSTTASDSEPDLVCKGNANIENGLSVTGTTSFVGNMSVKLKSSESLDAIVFAEAEVSNKSTLTLRCPVIANNNIELNAPLKINTGGLYIYGTEATDGIFSTKNISTDAGLYAAKVGSDYKFNVASTGTVTAESYIATSDKRLKENIIEYKPKKSILDLPIYKYDFINGTKNQIGCLAQDLKEICPEIVTENENGYLGIQESKLIYLLIDEVKKLKEKIK